MTDILIKKETHDLKPNSTVREVTVFKNRAQVTRFRELSLKKGENRIVFSNLGADIEEQTMRANLDSGGAVKLLSISLEQNRLYFFKELEHEKKYKQIIESLKKSASLADRKTVFALEDQLIADLRDYIRLLLNDIMLEKEVSVPRLQEALDFLETLTGENSTQVISLTREYEQLKAALDLQKEELNTIRNLDKRIQNNIVLIIKAESDQLLPLTISYMLGGVSWISSYDAALDLSSGRIGFSYFGEIRQTTGEEWDKIKVILSTAETEESIEIPKLHPVTLSGHYQKAEKELVVKKELKRELSGESAGDGTGDGETGVRGDTSAASPEVERRGGAFHFTLPQDHTIPPDGRYHRLLILSSELPGTAYYETVPELMEYVYLKATLKNSTALPLLPGRVMVFRNGSYMGKTNLDYLAPEEEFALSFGIDNDLRVKRIVVDSSFQEAKGLAVKSVKNYHYRYILYNYKPAKIKVRLKEAIHKADVKNVEVRIEGDTSKEYSLDEEGILSWEPELAPDPCKHTELLLHYTIHAPRDFNLEGVN